MVRSPLHDKLIESGAHPGEYQGVETALSFGGPNAEFLALREACAVYDLGWRAKIIVTGNDRMRWMNGMVTNNIRDLAVNRGNYNFFLNPQGRILADMNIYNRGEYLMVDTARWQVPNVMELFDKFIIMDEVEVTDASDKLAAIAVQGPQAREVLGKAGLLQSGMGLPELPRPLEIPGLLEINDAVWEGIGFSITRLASDTAEVYELWMSPENLGTVWNALLAAGAHPVGMDALEMFRIWAGIPRYGQDIRDRDLPQETEQLQALSFNKGCYVGQEIVERIHARGQVRRTFTGFRVQGGAPPSGSRILAEAKEVGEITSAATLPWNGGTQNVALGYIRREAATPGNVVQAGEFQASLAAVPFRDL